MKIETTVEVWRAIKQAHQGALEVFGTNTDMDGGLIMTQWGFHGAEFPIMEAETRWNPAETQYSCDGDHRYWLHTA